MPNIVELLHRKSGKQARAHQKCALLIWKLCGTLWMIVRRPEDIGYTVYCNVHIATSVDEAGDQFRREISFCKIKLKVSGTEKMQWTRFNRKRDSRWEKLNQGKRREEVEPEELCYLVTERRGRVLYIRGQGGMDRLRPPG